MTDLGLRELFAFPRYLFPSNYYSRHSNVLRFICLEGRRYSLFKTNVIVYCFMFRWFYCLDLKYKKKTKLHESGINIYIQIEIYYQFLKKNESNTKSIFSKISTFQWWIQKFGKRLPKLAFTWSSGSRHFGSHIFSLTNISLYIWGEKRVGVQLAAELWRYGFIF